MPLTDNQVLTLMSLGVLLGRVGREALTEFEQVLVREVSERWVRDRRAAQVTAEEWQVVERAIDAMRAEMREQLGELAEVHAI